MSALSDGFLQTARVVLHGMWFSCLPALSDGFLQTAQVRITGCSAGKSTGCTVLDGQEFYLPWGGWCHVVNIHAGCYCNLCWGWKGQAIFVHVTFFNLFFSLLF